MYHPTSNFRIRQVWQELSELLLFLLPLLNVTQLRRGLLKYLPRITGTGMPTSGERFHKSVL